MHLHTYSPTHPRTYTPTHLHTYAPTHLLTHTPMHLHTYTPTHLHIYTPMHLHIYTPTHPRTHTPMHLHTYTSTHPRTHTPTHPRTYTPTHPHNCCKDYLHSECVFSKTFGSHFRTPEILSNIKLKCKKMKTTAMLSYSARRYDSVVCCRKMSRDNFPSEALYEALEKFDAVPQECECLQDGGQSRWCMFYFSYFEYMTINSLHLCLHLLCRLLHCCKPLSKYAARPSSANLHLMQTMFPASV